MSKSRWLAVLALLCVALPKGLAMKERMIYPSGPDEQAHRMAKVVMVRAAVTTNSPEPPMTVAFQSASATLAVENGSMGTTLKVNSTNAWAGMASLTFKNGAAPPMRFTVRLSNASSSDNFSLTSGKVTLQTSSVGASNTTYFNRKGQPIKSAEEAVYTLTTKRLPTGELVVQVHRAAGVSFGKTITFSWSHRVQSWDEWGLRRLGG
jgi:hypothetical protein